MSIKVSIHLPHFTPQNLDAVSYTIQLLKGNSIKTIGKGSNVDAIPDILSFHSEDDLKYKLLRIIFTRGTASTNVSASFDIVGLAGGNVQYPYTQLNDPITIVQHYFA